MSRASIPKRHYFNIFVSHPDPNTRGALFHSSLPAMASAPVAVRMGKIQSALNRSKLKKDKWYCMSCIKREMRISGFFILSLSLP